MTTYSFVQYDVLNDLVYFKGTPTPGLVDTLNENQYDTNSIRGIINNDDTVEPLSAEASQAIINFLATVPEIALTRSKYITLTIEIIDDIEIGNVDIVDVDLDDNKTYVTKGGGILEIIIDPLKPKPKWKTMGRCRNCLKFTFDEDNDFNFTGNIGGEWDGTYKNGQKVYSVNIPTFPNNLSAPTYTNYRIFWKPNITYSGTDYNNIPFSIVNTHKWICVPSSSIGTISELSNTTFFHVLNNFSASCPYVDPPSTWYNFFGKDGFFRLENTPLPSTQTDTQQNAPCPKFVPTQYNITDWGYNCSATNCCVAAPSGSIATYTTFAECSASCLCGPPPSPTSSFGYNCVNGDCVPGTITYPGVYSTLAQCQTSCSYGYNCINGNCIPGTALATGSYSTLEQCQLSCTASYGYNCTPNGCVQGNALNTGSFATIEDCIQGCPGEPIIEITSCSCDPNTNIVTNGDFANGTTGWTFYPPTYTPGIGIVTIDPISEAVGVGTSNQLDSSNTSSVYLSQANIFNISCSYNVCFQAWAYASPAANVGDATIAISNGTLPIPNANLINGLTQTPTAYTITLTNVSTTDLTFYFGLPSGSNTNAEIFIDNICVTLIECPQTIEDCLITGSLYTYEEVGYPCICPEGYISDGSGSCIYTGSVVTVMPIGLPTSSFNLGNTFQNTSIASTVGASILQPGNLGANLTNGSQLPPNALTGQPSLYYQYNLNGTGNPSLGNPSPIAGNPNIYKTQYTFDILKNDFWTDPPAINPTYPSPPTFQLLPLGTTYNPPNPLPSWPWARWMVKRLRWVPGIGNPSSAWFGCGTAVPPLPVAKTYYLLVGATREFRVKLNGVNIVNTGAGLVGTNPYNPTLYPAYEQQAFSRFPAGPNNGPGAFPAPILGYNPYITNFISGSWSYLNQSGNWQASAGWLNIVGLNNPAAGWWNSRAQVFIYPITVPSGSCGIINVEARPGDTCASGWLGAVLFDNTAADIANATSINQLNILWDTSVLPDLTTLPANITNFPAGIQNNPPVFLYGYGDKNAPSPESYIPTCPSGSTPISGSACYGCETILTVPSVPCGDCIECVHGSLYNGYVVDKGGYMLQGRGPGGIVNTNLTANNTWVVPSEAEWDVLITHLNNGTAPSTTITGSLGTVAGGKLKDYTRDLNATCWENTNIGAQTNVSSSGWAGTAGGRRDDQGAFSGLGFEGVWWSANTSSAFPNPFELYTRELKNFSDDVYKNIYTKNYGFSIRLVRPAAVGEIDGTILPGEYTGNDGTLYDAIVIGTQVWITTNLQETQYNDSTSVTVEPLSTPWSNAINSPVAPLACFYDNNSANASILQGNIDPLTGLCYEFPTSYVYQKCGTDEYLVQTVSGSTIIPGKVQKDSNSDCWEFIQATNTPISYTNQTNYTGNYFSGSNYVYDDCNECSAVHTIYMKFGTKNC